MLNKAREERPKIILGGILIFAFLIRLYVLSSSMQNVNSDEAIIGLLARHILLGAHPLFYYGQQYYGPLDAYLTAPLFLLFGSSVSILRVVQLVSSLLFIVVVAQLGTDLYSQKVGLISAALAGVSPFFLTVRGLQSDAAYGLLLLFGTFSLLIFHRLIRGPSTARFIALIGICILGIWVFPLMLYYILAMCLAWLLVILKKRGQGKTLKSLSRLQKLVLAILGAFLLLALAWATGRNPEHNFFLLLAHHTAQVFLIAGPVFYGLLPPIGDYELFMQFFARYPSWAQFILQSAAVILFLAGMARGAWRFQQGNPLLFIFISSTGLVFVLAYTLININPTILSFPRYLFPLYSAIPLWADAILSFTPRKPRFQAALLAAIFGILLLGNIFFSPRTPAPPSLVTWFAQQEEVQYVYTNYQIGYALAFESEEKVVPLIIDGSHLGFNRYPPYVLQVLQSKTPAYLYYSGKTDEKEFRTFLEQNQLRYKIDTVGIYTIYSNLSQPVFFSGSGLTLASGQEN